MSEIAKMIDEVIKLDLEGRLKAAGYRKRGRTYHCSTAEVVKVVVLARSSSGIF